MIDAFARVSFFERERAIPLRFTAPRLRANVIKKLRVRSNLLASAQ